MTQANGCIKRYCCYKVENKMMEKKNKSYVHRAGGIILNKELTHIVLVLNRQSFSKNENKWGLPKGHLNQEEYNIPHFGARREILEETGMFIPIQPNDPSVVFHDTKYYIVQIDKKSNKFFQAQDMTEIYSVEWVPISKLKDLNMNYGLYLLSHHISIIKNNIYNKWKKRNYKQISGNRMLVQKIF
jgi:8-oxo-dGTP pyrophosphatase MutT (NUDIX family)